MIIGHAPSGYILAYYLRKQFAGRGLKVSSFFGAGVIGALIPDVDMIYFHLVDNRQHHHHSYFTHYPILWLGLLSLSMIWLRANKTSKNASLTFVFCLGGFLHLILDSIVGAIWWFAPFMDKSFAMFTVPSLYKPWWLNFILHWSFGIELLFWFWAIYLYREVKCQKP